MNLRNYQTAKDRRQALEQERGVKLSHIGEFSLDENVAGARNCENMIGTVQVPIGIAGPVLFSTVSSKKSVEYYLPLATTEGALVASVHRGCKAIRESGGATVDSYRVGSTRGPVFKVKNLTQNDELNRFLETRFVDLQRIAAQTSSHLRLTKYFSRGVGTYRYVRFVFDTQDAMGMNMATIATQAIVTFITQETGIVCPSLAANYDVDKKPAWLNVIEGRGMKVWAEVLLPHQVLQNVLKTSAPALFETWLSKCMLGSVMAGAMSFNAHVANVVAAFFLATGQDLAHVSEGSLGITTAEVVNGEDLYMSIYLPDVMIGTVGGGTGLATQQEVLSLLGITGGDNGHHSEKLAEILGAAVLAGEVSLLASLSEGSLAQAHQTLARGK